jgi:hypothetical protein
MSESGEQFRNQLLGAQQTSPEMYGAYQRELERMQHPPMTARSAAPGVILLVVLVACAGLIVRAMIVHPVGALMRGGYAVLAGAFVWAAWMIVRDLRRRKHSQKSAASVAGALTFAAGAITVVALLGLRHPSDPKALFGAFYVFVFYFACAVWAIEARIKSAELSTREQSLRIEYRLAELAERLGK